MKTKLFSLRVNCGWPMRRGQAFMAAAALVGFAMAGMGAGPSASGAASAPAMQMSLLPKLAGPQEPALAQINGEKLSARAFENTLTGLYGMGLFNEWVQVTLLRQACAKEGIHDSLWPKSITMTNDERCGQIQTGGRGRG